MMGEWGKNCPRVGGVCGIFVCGDSANVGRSAGSAQFEFFVVVDDRGVCVGGVVFVVDGGLVVGFGPRGRLGRMCETER